MSFEASPLSSLSVSFVPHLSSPFSFLSQIYLSYLSYLSCISYISLSSIASLFPLLLPAFLYHPSLYSLSHLFRFSHLSPLSSLAPIPHISLIPLHSHLFFFSCALSHISRTLLSNLSLYLSPLPNIKKLLGGILLNWFNQSYSIKMVEKLFQYKKILFYINQNIFPYFSVTHISVTKPY